MEASDEQRWATVGNVGQRWATVHGGGQHIAISHWSLSRLLIYAVSCPVGPSARTGLTRAGKIKFMDSFHL